jgi:HSP20 family protein
MEVIMGLITRHPLNLFNELQRDVNRLFDNRFFENKLVENKLLPERNGASAASLIGGSDWLPSVDIHEDKEGYVIAVDLPGLKPEDIKVSAHNGVLSISGKRDTVHEDKDQKRAERYFGSFLREFSMPENADLENVQASSKNGVLELRVPKVVKAEPKRIEVKIN